MGKIDSFELPKWIDRHKDSTSLMLAGSATPALSINDLISLSSNHRESEHNLSVESLKLSLGPPNGAITLREQIAGLYGRAITADQVLPTNGTTGANALAMQSLLRNNDHVIALYPSYAQLLSLPRSMADVEVSYWQLDTDQPMQPSFESLKELIRPNTRMIILNNPNNPFGTTFSNAMQLEIVALARSHDIILLVDEIFRPLYHDLKVPSPPSFVELAGNYEKIVVTGSVSKAWGLSGVRVGWVVTRSADILTQCLDLSLYTIMSLSALDAAVVSEALSDRCRPAILSTHMKLARTNLDLLSSFVQQNAQISSWTKPQAGATAFIRFRHQDGGWVDDVDFCSKLHGRCGVLLAPGSLCFGVRERDDFRGFVRVHLTAQLEVMGPALEALGDFVREYCHSK